MDEEDVCRVKIDPSARTIFTRNANRARVLFFLDPAMPIRASTSAFLSFNIPTQSTLQTKNSYIIYSDSAQTHNNLHKSSHSKPFVFSLINRHFVGMKVPYTMF